MWQEKTEHRGALKRDLFTLLVCIMERKKVTRSEIFNDSLMKKAGQGDITVLQLHLKVIFSLKCRHAAKIVIRISKAFTVAD